jgi:purine-nucleoside phosphorylase
MTNMAAGILDQPITSEEVLETSARVKHEFQMLVKAIVKEI